MSGRQGGGRYTTPAGPDERAFREARAELREARRQRIAFHVAVAGLIERHGTLVAARVVAATIKDPPPVWTDEEGRVFVGREPPDDGWTRHTA